MLGALWPGVRVRRAQGGLPGPRLPGVSVDSGLGAAQGDSRDVLLLTGTDAGGGATDGESPAGQRRAAAGHAAREFDAGGGEIDAAFPATRWCPTVGALVLRRLFTQPPPSIGLMNDSPK